MMYMGSGYITQRKIEKEDYSPFKGIVDDSITEVTADMLDGVTTISYYAFYQCANLISVVIPSGVTSIENYAFKSCTSLSSVTIPNGVTSIGMDAFSYCSSLTSITIPSSVTQIGVPTGIIYTVFSACSQLANVTVEATTPPFLSREAFKNTSSNLVIYVPAESVNAYKSASGWSNYASKIQAIP